MILHALHAKEAIAFALRLEVRAEAFDSIDVAARAFGLRELGDKWRGTDGETAARVLFAILIADMVHLSPRMSEEEARASCEEFLAQFAADSRFFTNGRWEDGWTSKPGFAGVRFGPESESATDATFDGGVIVLDRSRSGILWIEDED